MRAADLARIARTTAMTAPFWFLTMTSQTFDRPARTAPTDTDPQPGALAASAALGAALRGKLGEGLRPVHAPT
jgi:hypothetical protein